MSAVLENKETIATQHPVVNVAIANGIKQRLITVAEYDKMIEHGIYNKYDRVELLNGVLIEKMSKGPKHAALNDSIGDWFREKLGDRAYIRLQNPIVLNDFSEPEPDLVLAKPPRQTYYERHPKPEDIFLILEISDTTVSYDRNAKAVAYAKAGIIQYILLNLQNQTIEDYREPAEDGYQSKQTYHTGQSFKLVAFPDVEINVDELLPTE
jgi:Uma2 family endonuclease